MITFPFLHELTTVFLQPKFFLIIQIPQFSQVCPILHHFHPVGESLVEALTSPNLDLFPVSPVALDAVGCHLVIIWRFPLPSSHAESLVSWTSCFPLS